MSKQKYLVITYFHACSAEPLVSIHFQQNIHGPHNQQHEHKIKLFPNFRLIHYIVSKNVIEKRDQTENGMVNGDDDVNKGEEEKTCKESTPRNMADSRKALECRDSLECEKMAASSASEGDSAMSQVQ